MLRGRSLSLLRQVSRDDYAPGFPDRPPPCVCGRDVIEVTHGLAAAANRGWLMSSRVGRPAPGWRSWRRRSHSSRTLWPGGSRSEWRPGLLAQRFSHHPERAWSLLVRLSQNGHVKVRNIAQAMINAPCGRRSPVKVEILSVIEMHMPDGVRLSVAEWT